MGVGLARAAIQLIIFRTLLGIALAMLLSSSASLMTRSCPPGIRRNIGFTAMGMGQPVGYAVGLVIGGVFADTIGWRYGYLLSAILNGVLAIPAFWGLPRIAISKFTAMLAPTFVSRWSMALGMIDCVGVVLIGTALAMLSFVLAYVSSHLVDSLITSYTDSFCVQSNHIRIHQHQPTLYHCPTGHLALASSDLCSLGALQRKKQQICPHPEQRVGEPALRDDLHHGVYGLGSLQWIAVLYFSVVSSSFILDLGALLKDYSLLLWLPGFQVQHQSGLQTALRFLRMVIVGAITNVVTGLIVDKIPVRALVVVSALLSTASPVIMATTNPTYVFWRGPFEAMLLSPSHADGKSGEK